MTLPVLSRQLIGSGLLHHEQDSSTARDSHHAASSPFCGQTEYGGRTVAAARTALPSAWSAGWAPAACGTVLSGDGQGCPFRHFTGGPALTTGGMAEVPASLRSESGGVSEAGTF